MLLPELKLRRDKIRVLMAQQGIDAALITCNANLIYTFGQVVSGYLYLPLNAPARLFIKRPSTLEGEHIVSIRKPEQLPDLLKECELPVPHKLMMNCRMGNTNVWKAASRKRKSYPAEPHSFARPAV